MFSTRRGFLRGLVAAVAATAFPMSLPRPSAAATASTAAAAPVIRQAQGTAWSPLGPDVPIKRLFTPASGALFASSAGDLFRSDDGGTNWRQIALPATQKKDRLVEVDPLNHQVIYVDGDDGLQRSEDDAATWSTILPSARQTQRLAISAADTRVMYAAQYVPMSSDFWFHRSLDRGATWEQIEERHNSMCAWGVPVLYPHPSDPQRLFRSSDCYAGRDTSDTLEESRDNAATYQTIFSPKDAFPQIMLGGGGAEPSRFFLAVYNDGRSGGSSLYTSSDDGAAWAPILEYKGGGSMTQASGPSISIGGLTYDPSAPSRVFAALRRHPDPWKGPEPGGVVVTGDGGATWTEIGQPDLPRVDGLALGMDGKNLFAATTAGVWRLALP